MTPHYGEYYQGKSTPHDSGQPNPISFLVVPVGSEFSFNLTCDTSRLPEPLRATWRDVVRNAFAHAFDWLGFGAKTAVGYGALERDAGREAIREEEARRDAERRQQVAEQRARAEAERQRLSAMDPLDREMEEVIAAEPDKGKKRFLVLLQALRQGRWTGDSARRVAERVRAEMQGGGVWRETSSKKNPEKDHDFQRTREVIRYLGST
jgi:CRISPR-associated protein Cmr6